MKLKDKLRKDWLILGQNRLAVMAELTGNLSSVVAASDFDHFDCDLSVTLWERLCRLSIDSKGKLLANGAKCFDVTSAFEEYFEKLKITFSTTTNEEVYVLPSNWHYTGGFTISLHSLFDKLDEILFMTDDDLQIYSPSLNNSIIFSGDRHGDSLYLLEVYCLGRDWENLIG